jgi:hypothetical protein
MWLSIFTIMLVVGLVLGYKYVENADDDPILFSFQTFEVDVDGLPFPTVSTCDSSSLKSSQIGNIEK